jgi:hypothetical protein
MMVRAVPMVIFAIVGRWWRVEGKRIEEVAAFLQDYRCWPERIEGYRGRSMNTRR